MNLKRTFGAILTTLGIIGLIYGGYMFIQDSKNVQPLVVVAVISIIFFFSGIGLVRNTRDEA
jgi:uncharacterized membrane protein